MAVIPGALVDDLAKGMKELRSKRLLEVATYETEGFDVTQGGATKTYAKTTAKDAQGFDSAKWKRTAPDAKDLETTKVEDALFKVGGIEVAEFLDQPKGPEAYGLEAPALSLVHPLRRGQGRAEARHRQEGRLGLRPPPGRRRGAQARRGQGGRADQGLRRAVARIIHEAA